MKWVEHHEVSSLRFKSSGDKTIDDFFPFVLDLVDRVTEFDAGGQW